MLVSTDSQGSYGRVTSAFKSTYQQEYTGAFGAAAPNAR